ncbi:hypothetical protein [Pseudarthrobacter sp. NBSH8]|uniref:hypothetical protein n=1 Tax=Pseudarthrobacter sp. NBSH8 TaxID=2596911 RepID=UPI002105F701|nr:hypothetical protein [Pseudarthrobacter sp. NBSH8]
MNNYSNGMLLNHAGSFLHGKDGAKAGIWMKAEQRVGDSYKQEFYVGHAGDIRDTVATGETVSTKTRTYTDCVKVYDWTPFEKNPREHKYGCPEVGALVLTEDLQTGELSEFVDVVQPYPSNSTSAFRQHLREASVADAKQVLRVAEPGGMTPKDE